MSLPESRVQVRSELKFNLAAEDTLLEPLEPQGFSDWSPKSVEVLCSELSAFVSGGACVLVFEPTRPDIRLAILELGARFVDGGRLLSGKPDPSVFEYFRDRTLDLVIVEYGDLVPDWFDKRILIDARSQPYSEKRFASSHLVLSALGPRDGIGGHCVTWIMGTDSAMSLRAESVISAKGFRERAKKREAAQDFVLKRMHEYAHELGFESKLRSGFLWLGLPGFTCLQLEEAMAENGLAVFACPHHSYRHQIRLAPTNPDALEQLKLIFSRAYKSLVS